MTNLREWIVDGVTVVTGLAALAVAGHILFGQDAPRPGEPAFDIKTVPDWDRVVADGRRLGPEDAAMTIVEWGDYECPFCQSYEDVLGGMRERYPDQVAVVVRHYPLQMHRFAYDAARAAECAAHQDRFAEMHEHLYESATLDRFAIVQIARAIEMPDSIAFQECISDTESVDRIERDIELIRELGGTGTPSVAVNGTLFGVRPDSARLESMLEGILAERAR